MRTFQEFLEEARKTRIKFVTMHHGTDVDSASSIKKSGPKPSPSGSEGPGHYVTPDPKKAEHYSRFTSKQRGKEPGVVSYRFSPTVIQKTSDIPKGLTNKPKTTKEKPVVQNTRTGHVVMDPEYANRRMVRNPKPILRIRRKKK